ncbi:MAG: aspartate-semialdehyde dehydrogenase [Parachlamydiaceae bacterium]
MKTIEVGILGATGAVGQKFIELLLPHPWFKITAVAASERSVGKKYKEAVNWVLPSSPGYVADMTVEACRPGIKPKLLFSALDSSVATEIEGAFLDAGYTIVSNAKNFRMYENVPLLVPEVNPEQLSWLKNQKKGQIVTVPNCSTVGLALALKPLYDQFGIESVSVVTLQAISGAGYPGVASLDIVDNVIPFISGEEAKMETEPLKILGDSAIKISAHCNRVAVSDGHTECVSVKLKTHATREQVLEAWENYKGLPQKLNLPSAPMKPIYYHHEEKYPQPKLHRNHDKAMSVHIGRLRPCNLFDFKFTLLSHNTVRGAAGGGILNAELMVQESFVR